MNLATVIEEHEAGRRALHSRGEWTSYGQLRDQVGRARAGLLARGVEPGDRVAIVAANDVGFVVAYLAVLGVGAVAVPLNPASPAPELQRELGAVTARLVVTEPEFASVVGECETAGIEGFDGIVLVAELIAEGEREGKGQGEPPAIVARGEDDLAVLLFTSGTAGAPRPAMLTHGNLGSNIQQILGNPARPDNQDEVALCVIPLFHVFGLNALLGQALTVGSSVVLLERFDARASLGAVAEHGVTVLTGVPTMWTAWAALPEDEAGPDAFASVRYAVSGAAALDPEVRRAVRRRYGVDLTEGYGLTEASPAVTSGLGHGAPDGSIGVPLPGVEMRLVDTSGEDALVGDPGEIWVRGPNVFPGYWNDPEATATALTPDGWLRTGDVGVVDDDGFLSLVDRAKDVIIVSGFNVYPAEVEEVLGTHPAVKEVAVVGVPHASSGEAITAFVVPAPGAQPTEAELIAHVGRHLARYKCPSTIEIVDRLPHGDTGKVLRRALRADG
jgi:long-chain acyl-CoA synthetase